MPEPVCDLCYLTERDDAIVPAHRPTEALEAEAYAKRDLEIHVFTTPGEAAAFAAGVAVLASNRLRLGTGIGPLAHVVVLERLDGEGIGRLVLVDHGGARAAQDTQRWNWLIRFARTWDRTGHRLPTVMFEQPLADTPAQLKIEHQRFRVDHDGDTLRLTCPLPAGRDAIRDRLAAEMPDFADAVSLTPDELTVSLERAELRDRIETLNALTHLMWRCAHEQKRREERAATRQDRVHCRVVERMLEGWTLRNNHGRGELTPPEGNPARIRTIGYAMLDRLIAADLVRAPEGSVRGSTRGWNTVYAVGDLTGSGVRTRRDAKALQEPR